MVMSWIFTIFGIASILAALFLGRGPELAAAIPQGAQSGITLAISIAGSLCLWTGVGKLMEHAGFTGFLSKLLRPVLHRIFNAATPMGIQSAQRLAAGRSNASDELCRLIVLNTASIQLIPATVAAVRSSLGCATPFDLLPAVWITSFCSAGLGLLAAWCFGKLWRK